MSGSRSTTPDARPRRVPAREALPPLVPRTALAVFDEAIVFLRSDPRLLLGVAVAVLLPLRVIAIAMPGSPLRDARPDQLVDVLIGNLDAPGAVLAAFATLVLESVALFTVGSIYGQIAAAWYSARQVELSGLLVASIRRSPLLLVAWALVHLVELVGAVLSVGLLTILLGTLFMVTAPVMGAEGAGPWRAIRRSTSLVSARYGHGLFVFVIAGIGGFGIRLTIELAPSILGLELLGLPLWLVAGVADLVASVFVTALIAAVATVLYVDLRVRREGIDLAMAVDTVFADRRSG